MYIHTFDLDVGNVNLVILQTIIRRGHISAQYGKGISFQKLSVVEEVSIYFRPILSNDLIGSETDRKLV